VLCTDLACGKAPRADPAPNGLRVSTGANCGLGNCNHVVECYNQSRSGLDGVGSVDLAGCAVEAVT
jgi:hypothetical protein